MKSCIYKNQYEYVSVYLGSNTALDNEVIPCKVFLYTPTIIIIIAHFVVVPGLARMYPLLPEFIMGFPVKGRTFTSSDGPHLSSSVANNMKL